MPTAMTEKQVVQLWQETLQCQSRLRTEANESISIIYPGRRNDDRGADFKDAVIATRQGRLKGDIEIHVKASDWWRHCHHHDPAYNRVILHVVYQNDTENVITQQNGFEVPTLALSEPTESNTALSAVIPCRGYGYNKNIGSITRALEKAGEVRFFIRAAHLNETIIKEGAGQALYRAVMTALGYAKNKAAMDELACRLSLEKLETNKSSIDTEYLARCQARLMGVAGLWPAQRSEEISITPPDDDWEIKLENIWRESGIKSVMSTKDWNFFKVRPGNHPVRRLAAMSHLLTRYRKTGLLAGVETKLKEAIDHNERDLLEKALIVTPDEYWGRYLDIGVPALGAAPALLGRERAADIVINVLLPYAYARDVNREKTLGFYRNCPASEENTLIKHMRQQLGIGHYLAATACRQQWLIHIYQTWCAEGKCCECPLNNATGYFK
jgi:hypothetical protein